MTFINNGRFEKFPNKVGNIHKYCFKRYTNYA